ncbi:drug/metabolite transporter permease [Ligilactobacillus salitolerans]|uniref:Drug/metabolite transporter permease n=1 Tax=Ligilactobacillus salitolerans TaxID=1808352 RepID=A0A401IWB1_9LACO|nr:DMT family transporter [Ligilactobacillus salitolerans]GBG95798.1 drug/metabolite transporter permease [Ligilactobacillus salitolerans]
MHKNKGLFLIISSGILWGASGTSAQALLHNTHLSTYWLTGIRLLCAGSLLLAYYFLRTRQNIFAIWKDKNMARQLVLFAFFGMFPAQFTYFMAVNYGDAATATILQFLGPIFILLFLIFRWHRRPTRLDVVCVFFALLGTFLLVTKGHVSQLTLAPAAVFWGVMAGVSQASYTLLPDQLLKKFKAELVCGWAMILGGLPFIPLLVTSTPPSFTGRDWGQLAYIIIFGTAVAFLFYLSSLHYLKPTTTSMLSAFEPLTATILSILLLGTVFSWIQVIGGVLIIGVTFLQGWYAQKVMQMKE